MKINFVFVFESKFSRISIKNRLNFEQRFWHLNQNKSIPVASIHLEIGNLRRFLLHAAHIHCAFHQTCNWLVADKLVCSRVQSMFDYPNLNVFWAPENSLKIIVTQSYRSVR